MLVDKLNKDQIKMSDETFKSKLSKLIQKSRKAIRIYSQASTPGTLRSSTKPFADQQIAVWYQINEELLEFLVEITRNAHLRKVANESFSYAKRCQEKVREERQQLESKHQQLVRYSESGDFINSAKLSSELIHLKACVQARGAVLTELEDLLSYANLKLPVTHGAPEEQSELSVKTSKIIPFSSKKIVLK